MPTIPYHHATMRNAWYDTPLTDESPWERFLCPHNAITQWHEMTTPTLEISHNGSIIPMGHNHDRNGAKPHNAEFPHAHTPPRINESPWGKTIMSLTKNN